jgi:hypothetical protein
VVLQDSHVLSKWIYRRARSDATKNPNPVHVTKDRVVQHSKQLKEYLLCTTCEQRFGTWERRASALAYQDNDRAPLLDHVVREGYRSEEGLESAVFVAPDLAITLAMFSLSILWRAHESSQVPECSLGKYAEPVRLYLLGLGDLPKTVAVLLYFFEDEPGQGSKVSRTVTVPTSRKIRDHHAHRFVVHGFDVEICVGNRVPDLVREFCLVHAPVKRLLFEPTEEIKKWILPIVREHMDRDGDTLRARPIPGTARKELRTPPGPP